MCVCVFSRVVLGMSSTTMVLQGACSCSGHILCNCCVVRVHIFQHTTSFITLCSFHTAGRKDIQLYIHRGKFGIISQQKSFQIDCYYNNSRPDWFKKKSLNNLSAFRWYLKYIIPNFFSVDGVCLLPLFTAVQYGVKVWPSWAEYHV